MASTIRMARLAWGETPWLAAGAATAGELATPLWRGALHRPCSLLRQKALMEKQTC
ncbi:hypothetical protein LN650_17980 [Klebsiella pneumoniae subsp. pneumoniae]|nr:hypothetical protein [Klebsiella pneumoniae subsp. pneumoniae]